ncbi:hypothetical protein ASG11_07390 [Sphingomonas sp. Leaf357]|nr:hypothetical protein ASG11_07390 [Sphingomonas sp. Leaf357]
MRVRAILTGLGCAVAVAAPAQGPSLVALNGIQPGRWQLRDMDGGERTSLCVADPRMLIQLRHPGAQCSRFVVEDLPKSATVHYTCPGAGHGRTVISVESGHLIRLRTQGIADGAPFDVNYEGRRTGACR